jgi:hypothetical protein
LSKLIGLKEMKRIFAVIIFALAASYLSCDGSSPQAENSDSIDGDPAYTDCKDFTGNWSPIFDECYSELPPAFEINQEVCTLYMCDSTEPVIDSETGEELPFTHITNPGCVAYANQDTFLQDEDSSYNCEAFLEGDFLRGACTDLAGACGFLYHRETAADCNEQQQQCSEICQGLPVLCDEACTEFFNSCSTEPTAKSLSELVGIWEQ